MEPNSLAPRPTLEDSIAAIKALTVDRSGSPELLEKVETEADGALERLIAGLSECEADSVAKAITDRRSKLEVGSDITDQVVGISKQILAFGIAGLALTVGFADKVRMFSVITQKFLAIGGILYIELVLVSLLVLALYMLQAHFRYPFLYFKRIGNAWPWFYYASISDDVPRNPIQTTKARARAAKLYAIDMLQFAQRALGERPKARLRVEVQQYFLLLAYQGYVNQFSVRLTNLFCYGFAGSFASALVLAVLVKVGIL